MDLIKYNTCNLIMFIQIHDPGRGGDSAAGRSSLSKGWEYEARDNMTLAELEKCEGSQEQS